MIPKKSLGQHWLNDKTVLSAICEYAELSSDDTVLEIGPGLGSLTDELVKSSAQVIAIEKDEYLAQKLVTTKSSKNLRVVSGDILSYNLTELPLGYKVVANIPYYLTSKLLRVLSESANPPQTIVLLVQKEVAQRVAAGPGAMSILSVSVQVFYEAGLGLVVPAKLFVPPPKVDSQVLILNRLAKPLVNPAQQKEFFRIVKAGFSSPRKKLRSSLSAGLRITNQEAIKLLNTAIIDPNLRPQALSLEDWNSLKNIYKKIEK